MSLEHGSMWNKCCLKDTICKTGFVCFLFLFRKSCIGPGWVLSSFLCFCLRSYPSVEPTLLNMSILSGKLFEGKKTRLLYLFTNFDSCCWDIVKYFHLYIFCREILQTWTLEHQPPKNLADPYTWRDRRKWMDQKLGFHNPNIPIFFRR